MVGIDVIDAAGRRVVEASVIGSDGREEDRNRENARSGWNWKDVIGFYFADFEQVRPKELSYDIQGDWEGRKRTYVPIAIAFPECL